MSFAAQTKKELTLIADNECCRRSELEAMIALNGGVTTSEAKRQALLGAILAMRELQWRRYFDSDGSKHKRNRQHKEGVL